MARKDKNSLDPKRRSLITHLRPKSPIAEQYRTIRTNIQFSSLDQEVRTIVITSTGPGEGKSTTAANLAVVLAQQGKNVLLVDADLRKPTAHYTFGQVNTFGLTNVLTKQSELKAVVLETDVANLSLLTSGPIPPNPAELLASASMDELIQEALQHFDTVVFDTPPVMAVTDAQVLANKADGAVLVVASGKTEKEGAVKAKELLVSAKAKLLGVVLNRKETKQSDYYYYYGKK
ncbi:polysaccharide biosynthesis tyrosine autokinase [Anaerobacillus alkaliphilus]|uniref:non-specific protein-tyrosine kinase n=1 Tax=Anaerobacillus alkaliphilus TaxID=1548597 RepID=A0A4Q0VUZ5_9BACI|nr:CpsD/CapB family tyrosine-protein kinase [Anaerobacillus alkaliphilus]RXJ02263.1 polysaccharide biosynthesis tyrosine autokinase [Anaerobacillus alkaliphilus]